MQEIYHMVDNQDYQKIKQKGLKLVYLPRKDKSKDLCIILDKERFKYLSEKYSTQKLKRLIVLDEKGIEELYKMGDYATRNRQKSALYGIVHEKLKERLEYIETVYNKHP